MWFEKYELILFDFDGLLVDTEHLHFLSYKKMCGDRGCLLSWDFNKFCMVAHLSAAGLKTAIYEEFPKLFQEEPHWDVLYQEKKKAYEALLLNGNLTLMPGVEFLLKTLKEQNIPRCVVTNSAKIQVERIQHHLPALKTIPLWITREDYTLPKPAPDGYLKALETCHAKAKNAIGFEDSFRGLQSLYSAGIRGVLICHPDHPQIEKCKVFNPSIFSSFLEIGPDASI